MSLPSLYVACSLLFSILTVIGPAAAAWEEKFYNPKPTDDDLVLPLPCGGAMVFRQIEVATPRAWDDKTIQLGSEDENLGYAEGLRQAVIGGGFAEPGTPTRRYFWLGKYEVSQLQWEALQGTCPRPSVRGRVPVTGVNWFDAVQFAEHYTLWLYQHALDRLPREDSMPGFVRLPTEAEWEYAARGGTAVSDAAFRARTFPTPEGLNRYVWYQGSESAGGKLQPTGLLQPNPLGLYDMLGNAEEIVLDPFRLSVTGRLHGQAGGFVTKGGHYLTASMAMRSAYRREYAPFDPRKGTPARVQTVGFRLVLGATVNLSHERLAAIRAHWEALAPVGPQDREPQAVSALWRENAELKQALAGYQGSLNVSSEPPGMRLTIDDEEVGTTPVQGLKRLSGRYRLALTDPEGIYAPFSTEVDLEAASESEVEAQMVRGTGRLVLIGEERASVGVNGEYLPDVKAPGRIEVPTGKVVVEAQARDKAFRETLRVRHGEEIELRYALRRSVAVSFENPFELEPVMVSIRGGCFQMGSPSSEEGRSKDERQHRVCVEDFAIGKYEVRNWKFRRFRANHDSGNYKNFSLDQSDQPVVEVSWADAVAYAAWLSRLTDQHYRLPTEAEWEYAARAGTTTARFWGEDPDRACLYANVSDKAAGRVKGYSWLHACDDGYTVTAPLGRLPPNGYALSDILGNVWEWTCSTYDQAYEGGEERCTGQSESGRRVIRGGSWEDGPRLARSAIRLGARPAGRFNYLGFRLVQDR